MLFIREHQTLIKLSISKFVIGFAEVFGFVWFCAILSDCIWARQKRRESINDLISLSFGRTMDCASFAFKVAKFFWSWSAFGLKISFILGPLNYHSKTAMFMPLPRSPKNSHCFKKTKRGKVPFPPRGYPPSSNSYWSRARIDCFD